MEIPQLTFLRFIAATLVVIFHAGRRAPSLGFGLRVWDLGDTAVSFFFVFSGFILAHVYETRKIERVRDFYVARLARILPVYWLALASMSAIRLHRHEFRAFDLGLSALLLQSWVPGHSQALNTPAWSLSVELFFYLCFPWLLARLHTRSTRSLGALSVVVWSSNLVLHGVLLHASHANQAVLLRDFTFYSPITHVATFVFGVIGGILFHRHRDFAARFSVPLVAGSLGALVAVVATRSSLLALHHNGLFAPLFVALFVGIGAAPRGATTRVLGAPPLVLLGEASYGIYILQGSVWFVLRALLKPADPTGDRYFWTYYGVLVVVSVACFRFVETPLRQKIKLAFRAPSRTEANVPESPNSRPPGEPEPLTAWLPLRDEPPASSREAPSAR